jgi:hypothetical protein
MLSYTGFLKRAGERKDMNEQYTVVCTIHSCRILRVLKLRVYKSNPALPAG